MPAHQQCNSQTEVFNKTLAKYMKKVVNETTLIWEWYLAPLMFSYNTNYHSTKKNYTIQPTLQSEAKLTSFTYGGTQKEQL